jgi:hypothetical protein
MGRFPVRPPSTDRALPTDRGLPMDRPVERLPRPELEPNGTVPDATDLGDPIPQTLPAILEMTAAADDDEVAEIAPPVPLPPARSAVASSAVAAPPRPLESMRHPGPRQTPLDGEAFAVERGATAPQLRRFIKSRAYVPMHELRRRFAINGGDDEVAVIDLEGQRVYVGLPPREGHLLAELLRGGDIGYELSLDPISPIVVGVYPMRPVTRA